METKNTYLSFQEWKKDYFEVENKKENRDILLKYGVIYDLGDNLHDETIRIRIYKKGGHLEILENGLFSVGLDRTTYQDEKLEPIEKELYKWCNGELLEDTPIGLKGIKETLEERENKEDE